MALLESPLAVTLSDIGNIVTFIAPGYFAVAVYSIKYAKSERSFSKILIESLVWSLPLVAINNYLWERVLHLSPVTTLDISYALMLLGISVIGGFIFALLRVKWPINKVASRLGIDSPHEDFVRSRFTELKPGDSVAVRLKSGKSFSGAPAGGSIYSKDGPRKYCFDYIAWYDNSRKKYDETGETIMVDLDEVEYFVLPKKGDEKDKQRISKFKKLALRLNNYLEEIRRKTLNITELSK